jgi:parvulin-like peptidyl-prolyl isomerase
MRSKDVPLDRVAAEFGIEFAGALGELPERRWQGPVRSSYGLHLVRIDERTAAAMPALAEVRAAVQREWENERRLRARDARLKELRERYTVVVEDRS